MRSHAMFIDPLVSHLGLLRALCVLRGELKMDSILTTNWKGLTAFIFAAAYRLRPHRAAGVSAGDDQRRRQADFAHSPESDCQHSGSHVRHAQ